jgi:hypothetical protein
LIVISVLFLSPKAGLMAMGPNLMPILINFGVMGYTGIALSPGTFSVAVIALGIAVDDTIHFMVRYYKEMKCNDNQVEAMHNTVTHEFRPVLSSSVALAIGFSVLGLSEFGSTAQFGFLAAVCMGAALMSDLFMTPALLMAKPLITSWDYLRLKIDNESVHSSALFKGFKVSEIKKLALMGKLETYQTNQEIIHQHDTGRNIYLVLSGCVEVNILNEDGETKTLSTIKQGGIFGEMAFVTGEKRTANILATNTVEVLVVNEQTLDKVNKSHPRISAKLFRNLSEVLSERLKGTTNKLVC